MDDDLTFEGKFFEIKLYHKDTKISYLLLCFTAINNLKIIEYSTNKMIIDVTGLSYIKTDKLFQYLRFRKLFFEVKLIVKIPKNLYKTDL